MSWDLVVVGAGPAGSAAALGALAAEPGLRVLLLAPRPDGAVGYALVTGDGARLGDADLRAPAGQREALDDIVADLLTPRGSEAAAALSTRAVRYVGLPADQAGGALAAALDAQQGLTRRSQDPAPLWEVLAPTSRLVVLAPGAAERATSGARAPEDAGDVLALDGDVLPDGPAGRLLVLAEAADPGWQAELDGEPLEPVRAWQWAQAFVLPADGGELVVGHDPGGRRAALALQAIGLLTVLVLAAPGVRLRRGLEPAELPDDAPPAHPAPAVRAAQDAP